MVKLSMRRGFLEVGWETPVSVVLEELRERWPSLIKPAQDLMASRLDVDPQALSWGRATNPELYGSSDEATLMGEIFVIEGGLLIVSIRRQVRGNRVLFRSGEDDTQSVARDENSARIYMQVSSATRGDGKAVLDEVSALVADQVGLTLEVWQYPNSRFVEVAEEVVSEALPTELEYISAAEALLSREARSLAIAVKSSRGLLASDAARHERDGSDATVTLSALVQAGVLARDVVVVCGQTGTQVARVPDESSLEGLAAAGLRCACGRPIDQERPERMYTVTERGVLLLDKSRWMSILVRQKLLDLGVPPEQILLECTIGGNEVDCIALISGELAIMELKDKEFSMGNAYSFGAKISILHPDHAVIVATETIGSDVRAHFDRTRQSDRYSTFDLSRSEVQATQYIEGAKFLDGLEPLVSAIYKKDAGYIVEAVLRLTTARASGLLPE